MSFVAIRRALAAKSSRRKAIILSRFFRTAPGEYGAGDRFLGVTVPDIRSAVRAAGRIGIADLLRLLASPFHEERFAALIILIRLFERADADGKTEVYELYMRSIGRVNSWDLVDLSAPRIVGAYLFGRDRSTLYRLVSSSSLWERRIAIVATFYFIRRGRFTDTLKLVSMVLDDPEDLIHKAAGWMLREVAKRDRASAERFLARRYRRMPRTMLRYAIERLPEVRRRAYLKGRV